MDRPNFPQTPRFTRPATLAAGAAILAVAALVRLSHLEQQGLLLFDEGQLILEAHEFSNLLHDAGGTLAGRPGAHDRLAADVRGCSIIFARPVHNAAVAASILWSPGLRADQASLRVSAIAGILSVAAVGWLGAAWFGPEAGVLAALLLAVSPYHLLYSREGLSDSLAVLWWILTLAGAVSRARGTVLVSGLCAGLCIGTNYRAIFLPLVVLPLILQRGGVRAALAWSAAFLVPLAGCEAVYRGAAALAGLPAAAFPTGTYGGQLTTLVLLHGQQEFPWRGFGAYPYYVWRWEGAGGLVLLLLATGLQLTRWRGPDAALNLAWLTPWFLFSIYWDNASRFFVLQIPLLAVMKSRWLLAAGRRLPRPALTGAALGLAAAGLTLPAAIALVPRPTPYLVAAEFLARTGDPRHLSSNARLGRAYLGPAAAIDIPADRGGVRTARRAGWRWVVTDLQVMFGGADRPEDRFATALWIADGRPSVLTVPYSNVALAQGVLEQDLHFADARKRLRELEAHCPRLHIFDLNAAATPGGAAARP